MSQTTLGIVKPDAVAKGNIGNILKIIEDNDLQIAAMKMVRMSKSEAEGFYYVHRQRPFFGSLTGFMSEGPVVLLALRGQDAIARWRQLMGATNPEDAEEGTIRKLYAESIERNSVHGSDSPESAAFELRYFFNGLELQI
ncbi:MAG TPA: nucleoside-diphosphate kinase [Acidobacteriota bacterium]|nr:nucleoside-diphosphate kinase [Acidobacteriota bacterium]